MKGTTSSGSGDNSPPGRARSPLGRESQERCENGEEVLDRMEALGPPPQTPSASREKLEEAYLPVLEHLSGFNDNAVQQGEKENGDSDIEKEDDYEDAIFSENSVDSLVLGIVERCRKEEEDVIKAKRPVRYSVKRRAEANLDTSSEEEEGKITTELRSRNRKTRILGPESGKPGKPKKNGSIYDLTKDEGDSIEGNPLTDDEGRERDEGGKTGKEGPYKTIGRLGIEYGPPPENFKYDELSKMQVMEVGTLALDWIFETNSIRGKSDIQGKSMGT
ncbi:hypothetical protein RF55_11243 [Lasius niger]|uniref:Uncharacterized protein n=1 Tax=Lasius niger TaxID=67767 RepID=A0A0J7KG33_LASNI|nr:hypothetical protein RF55_11243 [Lasius niger]